MEQGLEYRQQLLQGYKQMISPLLGYLPWLEANQGQPGSRLYRGEEFTEHSMSFPVYDGTLLRFVKETSRTKLMDKNYRYVYTRNHIRTPEDERRVIRAAELKDWDILRGILSRYVLGGMTKASLWSQAVQEDIFYLVLSKMKEIIEYWDKTQDS